MITLRKTKRLRPASKNRVNFDHHHLHKNQVNRSSHSKQVNFGAHMINFEPPHKKQVTVDCNTKTKSNSIPPTKIKLIPRPLLQSSQFDPYSKIKSISMPSHKDQVNFDPHTKTKYFSISKTKSILIPSKFRSPLENQVNFDAATPEPSSFRSVHQNHVYFDPHTRTK